MLRTHHDYLGFITEGKLAAVLIIPSLGVSNWSVIYIINTAPSTSFLAPLPRREKTYATWSHARTIFYFVFSFALLYFLLASFYQKYK
jgi:hypothetical protein